MGAFGASSSGVGTRIGRSCNGKRAPRKAETFAFFGADVQVRPGKERPGPATRLGTEGLPSLSPSLSPLPRLRNRHRRPLGSAGPAVGRTQDSGGGRVRWRPPPNPVLPFWAACPPHPLLTHRLRSEGARRLSGRCSGRSWKGAVGSSGRGAGSCQWKWGRPQVRKQLPPQNTRPSASQSCSPKRRQLVLLKSLNLVPKSTRPNGVRCSHARSNRKAVGGGVLTHAQLEAAEAGPSCEAQPPSFFPAPRVRKDAAAGAGLGERPPSARRPRPGRTWR